MELTLEDLDFLDWRSHYTTKFSDSDSLKT